MQAPHDPIFNFLKWFLPPLCLNCYQPLASQGLCHHCWSGLEFISDPFCNKCGFGLVRKNTECTECLRFESENRSIYTHQVRSCFYYQGSGRQLILAFKQSDRTELAYFFSAMMQFRLWHDLAPDTLVVPVPLHPIRLWLRRYNQAGLLAAQIAQSKNLELTHTLLKRNRLTKIQGKISRKNRYKNMMNAFIVKDPHHHLRERPVLLVDDVFTTGATLSACAKILIQNGAKHVRAITIARVKRNH
ncbi:MAG: ComF family protein [Pseudomonadota bacterium]